MNWTRVQIATYFATFWALLPLVVVGSTSNLDFRNPREIPDPIALLDFYICVSPGFNRKKNKG